jgi:beta-glucanase (GH16 family)
VSRAAAARRRRLSRAALPLLVLLASVLAVAAVEASRSEPGRKLVLNEEFDGTRLNADRWRTCHWWAERGCTIASNHELESYWPEQARVRGGVLRLVATRRATRDSEGVPRPYASGMISSGPGPNGEPPLLAFRYGRAEIRARVPTGKGLWSAFWLLPADRESKPEIDVLENLGHDPDNVQLHVHWRNPDGENEQLGHEWRGRGLATGWHTYAIDWRPDLLTWSIDGRLVWSARGDAVPQEPMYPVVNLAVGGDWPGTPDAATRFPSSLLVDSIKVWR